jgi:hypothetical protein
VKDLALDYISYLLVILNTSELRGLILSEPAPHGVGDLARPEL